MKTLEMPKLPTLEPLSWDRVPFALSIRQPWAWCILNAGKDVENRTWSTTFRGLFAIHAARGMTSREYDACQAFMRLRGIRTELPKFHDFDRGGIVGIARLTNCVEGCLSPWWMGPIGFKLADVVKVPFRPMKGRLHFWKHGLI
jgi:hypothetical protein